MALEPPLDLRALVRAQVVEDHVQVAIPWRFAVNPVEEADEVLAAVARHALADDFPVEHVERRKQNSGPVTLVVVRHRSAPSLLQGQAGLGCASRGSLRLS
jgi:hypothetical protein